jgi:hypothetical protein
MYLIVQTDVVQSEGRVEFRNIVFKYRPELPPVLKDLSLTIEPGEKIGIVGRYVYRLFLIKLATEGCFLPKYGCGKVFHNDRPISIG